MPGLDQQRLRVERHVVVSPLAVEQLSRPDQAGFIDDHEVGSQGHVVKEVVVVAAGRRTRGIGRIGEHVTMVGAEVRQPPVDHGRHVERLIVRTDDRVRRRACGHEHEEQAGRQHGGKEEPRRS